MEEASHVELHRTLDLCFAVAAPETEPFLRYLWLRPEIRPRLRHFARVALAVALRNSPGLVVPDGLVAETAAPEEEAEAVAHVRAVARAVVPTLAVYKQALAWLEVLLDLETERRLERLSLPEEVLRSLRGCVYALVRVHADLAAGEAAFRDRWASPGGWTPLTMILDWEFFRRTWEILGRHRTEADVREVVEQIRRACVGRSLPDPHDVIASHGP